MTPTPIPDTTDRGDSSSGDNNNSSNGSTYATATFTPVSNSVMTDYVGSRPVNNPTNIRLQVSLRDVSDAKPAYDDASARYYAGEIKVSYYDNGYYYYGLFKSGEAYNQISYKNRDKGKSEAEWNRWFTYQGKQVFHGFFQDTYGAVILVIDGGEDLGDGAGLTSVSGSVWYKNFGSTYAPMSPYEKCWFVRAGPYNCRTFMQNGEVNTYSALYPTDGYKKLGTFTGLNKPKAFNE